jgi:4-hydroxybenzoate polyprenyltransferase
MLKKVLDLILYSNFYIACCAVAMTLQTQLLLFGTIEYTPVIGLIFFATLMIYAVHRIVGLFRLTDFIEEGRYYIINKFKSHIWLYAGIGLIGSFYCFFQLQRTAQFSLVIPAFLSLGYIFPVFGKKNLRLRDFNGVKIFLVAIVWAYVSVILPTLEGDALGMATVLMFLERALFIFAITLPFDIRDLKVDAYNEVKTIPATLGVKRTQWLSIILLGLMLLMAFFLYEWNIILGLFLSVVLTAFFIKISPKQTNDYFFTGLMDGTMIIQPLLVGLVTVF